MYFQVQTLQLYVHDEKTFIKWRRVWEWNNAMH